MARHLFLLVAIALAAPAPAASARATIHGQWGMFEQASPRSCYAMAGSNRVRPDVPWKPSAAVAYWPDRRIRAQLHVRLSRERRPGSAVLLRIDDRIFQLAAGRRDAWAPNAATDAEIVAAMRTGVQMRVETRSPGGGSVRDTYSLRGFATALDAAAIACIR